MRKIQVSHNCNNCWAPHDGVKCDYCGTEYKPKASANVYQPGWHSNNKAPQKKKTISLLDIFMGIAVGFFIGGVVGLWLEKRNKTLKHKKCQTQ